MAKVVLLTDLDNTIIHGRKKYRDGDICVERDISGKEITYVGENAFKRFIALQERYIDILEIIPVTSRSEAEYLRIIDTGVLNFRYAFVDNGAGLMKGRQRFIEGVWRKSNRVSNITPYLSTLESYVDRVRLVDDCFYFGKIREGRHIDDYIVLEENVNGSKIYLQRSANKLYLLTDRVSKGNAAKAVANFNNLYGNGSMCILCAGDSIMDVAMSDYSDIAIFSDSVKLSDVSGVRASIQFVKDSGDNLINSILDNVERACKKAV